MITSSGAICDICGKYILGLKGLMGLKDDERINMFTVKGIEGQLCCHNECKKLALKIGNDWTLLPKDGNLYKAFKNANDKLKQGINDA